MCSHCAHIFCSHLSISLDTQRSCPIETVLVSTHGMNQAVFVWVVNKPIDFCIHMGISFDTRCCPIGTVLVSTHGYETDCYSVSNYHAYIFCSHKVKSLELSHWQFMWVPMGMGIKQAAFVWVVTVPIYSAVIWIHSGAVPLTFLVNTHGYEIAFVWVVTMSIYSAEIWVYFWVLSRAVPLRRF